jgi:hypothetical protein
MRYLSYIRYPGTVIDADNTMHGNPLCDEIETPWRLMCDEEVEYAAEDRCWCDPMMLLDIEVNRNQDGEVPVIDL